MSTRSLSPWDPPNGTATHMCSAGKWWDAVKVPTALGTRTLEHLADSGAIIEDQDGSVMYWLIAPDSAGDWEPLPSVTVLGTARHGTRYVAVPPVHKTRGRGLRWLIRYAPDRYLTDAGQLHAALEAALSETADAVPAPHSEAER